MKAVGSINDRPGFCAVCGQAGQDTAHGRVTVDQLKLEVLHQLLQLMVGSQIIRTEGTADEVNLMADNSSAVQTMIVVSVRRSVVIGSIMHLKSHGLQDTYIAHFKLRNKAADGGN